MNKLLKLVTLSWFTSFVLSENTTDCGISVDYVGNSGQFKLQSDCSTAFLKVKMNSVIEYDGSGDETSNKVTSFASQDYDWDTNDGEDSTYQGLSAVQNTFVATLLVGTGAPATRAQVPFSLTTILFLEEGSIDVNDESVDVDENSLKWSIEIDDWPFEDSGNGNNTLQLCMSITSGGNDNEIGNVTDMDSGSDSIDLGDFTLILEDSVELDGELTDGVTISINDEEESSSDEEDEDEEDGVNTSFCWTFDGFSSSLVYDPIVSYNTLDNDDSNGNENGNENEDSDSAHMIGINCNLYLFVATVAVGFHHLFY